MKLPARTIDLPAGLRCPSYDVAQAPWLAHVVKHPLGIGALMGRPPGTTWNREGWDELVPPVIDPTERERLVRNIAGLDVDDRRCAVPEMRGATDASSPEALACYTCPRTLASQCAWLLDDVSKAYAAVAASMVEAFDVRASVAVPRAAMLRALTRLFWRPDTWQTLALLSVGRDARQGAQHVARISRADGVRAEFYLAQTTLRWRTTWRSPPAHAGQAMSFLLDFPATSPPATQLSDLCLVDRLWWERHGV
jgi:hypothetical protein